MLNLTSLHRALVASLEIHPQQTFTPLCPDELPVAGGDEIVRSLNLQAQYASKRLLAKEAHHHQAHWIASDQQPALSPVQGAEMDIAWPPHAIVGSPGFDLIPGLPPLADYDYVVWQGVELDWHPYGACYHDQSETMSTGIIEYLHQNNISTVIVGGLATDYCVKVTVLQLLRAEFRVIVHLDAIRGVAPETTAAALTEMKTAGAEAVEPIEQCHLIKA